MLRDGGRKSCFRTAALSRQSTSIKDINVTRSSSPPQSRRRARLRAQAPAALALAPAAVIAIVAYIGAIVWTVTLSFTNSKLLPSYTFVGLSQYVRLFNTETFTSSGWNILLFGVLFIAGSLVFGFLLAVFIDQNVRCEGVFRTIFLYPYAMSFVVTGLVWQWFLSPELGVQKIVRDLGFSAFTFDWLVNPDMVIYTLVIAAIWQASGLVMALLLAGLRGVDSDLWKAIKIDAIPTWRAYVSIILPTISPMVVTATVLLATAVAKLYDLVVAMTLGGPGISSQVPAKFVMDNLLERANVGLATSAATVMLVTVVAIMSPFIYAQHFRRKGVRK
ncbi:sugar ABC transporter permease (plasmid) [Rhizobium sp. CB3060]|uniref:carbohydrate ABC transporter permease n=1 Tax=Rhizobium sp. CB3060 TaxID=3138255 RepID=UPI0021A85778|nr:sugar ABC transporter permease [Rhizobium tropici]UWU26117.1 sugar ABC transporter permease [Rhizobium tropici]